MPPIPGLGMPRARPTIGQQIQNQQSNLLRRGVGGSGEKYDKMRQRHIWSTYTFHSGTGGAISAAGLLASGDYPIFTTPVGQNGQGYPGGLTMSQRDTNVPGVQRISDNQNFSIWELGVTVMPLRQDVVASSTTTMSQGAPNAEDVDQVCNNVVLQIVYLTNRVTLGHVSDFPSPGGPSMTAPTLLDSAGNTNAGFTGGGLGEGVAVAPFDARQLSISNTGGTVSGAPALRRKFKVPIYLQSGDTFSFIYFVPRTVQFRTVANGGRGGFALRLDWWAVESFREQG